MRLLLLLTQGLLALLLASPVQTRAESLSLARAQSIMFTIRNADQLSGLEIYATSERRSSFPTGEALEDFNQAFRERAAQVDVEVVPTFITSNSSRAIFVFDEIAKRKGTDEVLGSQRQMVKFLKENGEWLLTYSSARAYSHERYMRELEAFLLGSEEERDSASRR